MPEAANPVTELFARALDLDPAERERFLREKCGAHGEEVRELLAHHERAEAEPFWEQNAMGHEAAAPDAAIGETLGAYRIEALIGTGGMGRVYRAHRADAAFEKPVAIKRIKRGMDADEIVARFRAERQILAGLEHPNIARLLDGGTDAAGLPFLVMEYVEGLPLPAYLASLPRFDLAGRLRLFREICAAVHYAHQRMVIHRDLKPSNLLVDADGRPKLLDFGIARLLDPALGQPFTQPHERVLTPDYASPEQLRGELVTTASDVYSLGVILHELLTGTRPGTGTFAIQGAPERRRDLERIVLTALAEEPGRRYSSVAQLSDDVGRYMDRRPVAAQGDSLGYLAARFLQRHKLLSAAAVLVVLTVTVGLVATRRAQARAERRFVELQTFAHAVVFNYADAIKGLPGSTPVQQMLIKDSLAYLDRLSAEAGGDASLRRDLIGAYSKISQVQGDPYHDNVGDSAAALRTGTKAVRLGEELVRDEASVANIMALADAYDTLSNVQSATGDLQAVEANSLRALALYQQADRVAPNDLETRLLISQAYWGLGDLNGAPGMGNLGRSTVALEYYRKALATAREAEGMRTPVARATRMRVFWSLDSLGLMELAMGDAAGARRDTGEALGLIRALVKTEPGSTSVRSALSLALDHAGRLALANGDAAGALGYYREAVEVAGKAFAADPKNVGNRRKLGIIKAYYSLALRRNGSAGEAVAPARESFQLMQELAAGDPGNADFRSDVSIANRRMAEAYIDANARGEALPYAVQAIAGHRAHVAQAPNSFVQLCLARALVVYGDALGAGPERVAAYEEARGLLAQLARRDAASAMLASEYAQCLEKLARGR